MVLRHLDEGVGRHPRAIAPSEYGAVILHECCYVLQYCDCLKPLSSVLNMYVYACVFVIYNPYARV